jgi:hypothetical protein
MKRLILALLLSPLLGTSQTKKDIEQELKSTKSKLDSIQALYYQQQVQYQQRIISLEATIDKIKFLIENNVKSSNGLQGNTVVAGNDTLQKTGNGKKIVLGEGDGLTPSTGGKIYTGSKGGQYYINKNGNKVYIKKKN